MAAFDERYYRTLITQLLVQAPDALETDHLEIKGWCRDERELIDKSVDAAICLANAEGGRVLVGADEDDFRRFSRCPHAGISPAWLVRRIQDQSRPPVSCRAFDLSPLLAEIRGSGDAHLFVIEVDRKRCISGHTNAKGISKIRVGKECRIQYTADDDRTSAVVPDASTSDLSLDSIRWAMAQQRRSFDSAATAGDAWEFLAQARLLQASDAEACDYESYGVTLAGFLLFGKRLSLARAAPYCETVLQTRTGAETLRENLVEMIRDLLYGDHPRLCGLAPLVPIDALRELLVNAFVHRCWRTPGPVVITVSPEAVEIANPGDLPSGMQVGNLIYCVPVYRNLLLAEGMRIIGLADKIGQGIDIAFKSLICAGLDFPVFESHSNRFSVRIALAQNREFQEFIRVRGSSLPYLDELVVLRYLWTKPEAPLEELATALQRGRGVAERCLQGMRIRAMVETDGTDYHLSPGLRRDIESIFSRDQMNLFGA